MAPHRLALRVFPLGNETFVDESCEFTCVSLVRGHVLVARLVGFSQFARESFAEAVAAQRAYSRGRV